MLRLSTKSGPGSRPAVVLRAAAVPRICRIAAPRDPCCSITASSCSLVHPVQVAAPSRPPRRAGSLRTQATLDWVPAGWFNVAIPVYEPLLSLNFPCIAAAALGANMTQLYFTPVHALLGGLALGIAALGKMALTGRILGISGIVKGLVNGDLSGWRLACTGGLLAGGALAGQLLPQAFDVLPASFTVTQAAVGGLLVGFGASLGNGCTSGHGICGLGRLSVRSLVNVLCFMGTGVITATLAGTAASLGISSAPATLLMPTPEQLQAAGALVAAAAATQLLLAQTAKKAKSGFLELVSEFSVGLTFALGLVAAGMVRPSKVAGFLSITHPAWDPSLMFVMGGGLLLTVPGFTWMLREKKLPTPLLTSKFSVPTSTTIDWPLVLGGVLFGAGWGISGMCPGPAVVALAGGYAQQIGAYVAAMLAGMWLQPRLVGGGSKSAAPKAA